MTPARPDEAGDPRLLTRVSRSMFWNALLLPLIAASNFALAILIRRHFLLESGLYDALIGILNTLLFYSGLGLPHCLNRFLAELETEGRGGRVRAFLAWTGTARFGILTVSCLIVYLAAGPVASFLTLGADGTALLRVLLLLVVARALLEFVHRSLQGLLQHGRANLAQLTQAILAPLLILGFILTPGGLGIRGVFPLLALATVIGAGLGGFWLRRSIRELQPGGGDGESGAAAAEGLPLSPRRLWGYALFMFGFEISNYFVGPGFLNPALLKVLGDEAPVALFNVGFQLPMMITVLVISSFQGVYRPLFARLLVEEDAGRLRGAFFEVSKVQAFLLVPAAVGLATVADDLIPLAFGEVFLPSAAIAAVLSLLFALETLFNLGSILLSTAQRYRPVAISQGIRLLAGPAFVAMAASAGLLPAAVVFGLGRAAATGVGYLYARSHYGVTFPWRFLARLAAPVVVMATVVVALGVLWPSGWTPLLVRVATGALVFAAGVRIFRILGPREAELLERAQLPGGSRIIAWLIP